MKFQRDLREGTRAREGRSWVDGWGKGAEAQEVEGMMGRRTAGLSERHAAEPKP